MGYSLVVFDWDGTLMDSTHSIVAAIQGACRDLDLPVPSASSASWVIGLSLESALRRAVPELTQAMVPRFLERYRTHYLLRDSELRLFEGVRELLADLASQDVRLAVATGKSRVGLNRALAATGLGPLFDATRTADETFSKPHPAMLQELMHELGHEADAVVMVGDTSHDLQMAANAGVHGLGVAYGAHTLAELEACAPQAVVDSVAVLREWLLARSPGRIESV
ncbi:hydrolase [Bordetella pertussis]|uniref:Pyrophosphatase ppaX n=4 Tax=Bordetella pertussis TaxID=520 RepID=A0A0E7UQU4_BORPT|nr:HAD family hydrolase [Bordetella pertussis]ETH39419.1 HAD hydrolase, family IA, variant 1 [Bordetella pertussis H918]ETH42830.1 HAD hydrolase, family IA, variant 1 [Bordetella pertussis H939]ETH47156.1 HAD hydrolase, family IA, variant 1 [Bordetella pertussis H921]ETH70158.1 HAD hydrolase, family IA, variant 1 [Bordetella pertussis STO1-CHLA-0011]ETH84984.1 HAD hydrolase, family IA, variant 1 [Bordetella pertussis STO1-CHOC-0017]ETH88588.1 HAD hydrolase, family IA, variant 1 [Bordetella pe